ncbi:LysM domain-containing protein [Colletotrichum orbiculare MAFF 240422]|uniref:LysM domain-containing protein n=1 Tax=Colletotrichum orbiculare (strain 104-T / ATCC 96160 / CBS 514.97 / LARS 414 / MAFF 240422) TaxID=1213857 RepID=N4W364_COLOR|nr:LysM domain-containing protein [Colletotrichum orbiculare MAFF 240422]
MARLATQVLLLLAAAATAVVARSPAARFPYDDNTTSYCTWWLNYEGVESCNDILDANWITIDEFRRWNPSVGAACAGLETERSYCVEAFGEPEPTAVPTPTPTVSPTPTTAPGNGVATPQPTQPGMVDNCNRFHFVAQGDSCAAIASRNGISLAQLVAWNDVGGADCRDLWANAYVCVRVIGVTPTTPAPAPTIAPPGNGISTPVPTKPGMVGNCDRFYYVEQGDSCDGIVARHGITLAQFTAWNDVGGADCRGMWANAWVCVRVLR